MPHSPKESSLIHAADLAEPSGRAGGALGLVDLPLLRLLGLEKVEQSRLALLSDEELPVLEDLSQELLDAAGDDEESAAMWALELGERLREREPPATSPRRDVRIGGLRISLAS